jgi:hypothetical protein
MNESTFKSALVKELRATCNAVVLRHEDQFTHGIPDISVTLKGTTSWYEAKYVREKKRVYSRGIQRMTMEKLNEQGVARYILWVEEEGKKFTFIVEPTDLDHPEKYILVCEGFNPRELARFIRNSHD